MSVEYSLGGNREIHALRCYDALGFAAAHPKPPEVVDIAYVSYAVVERARGPAWDLGVLSSIGVIEIPPRDDAARDGYLANLVGWAGAESLPNR